MLENIKKSYQPVSKLLTNSVVELVKPVRFSVSGVLNYCDTIKDVME